MGNRKMNIIRYFKEKRFLKRCQFCGKRLIPFTELPHSLYELGEMNSNYAEFHKKYEKAKLEEEIEK